MSAFDLATWLANDAPKIKNKPGLSAMHDRVVLAAEALDRILAQHAGCKPGLCPTIDAYRRVLSEHGYRGEARWGDIQSTERECDGNQANRNNQNRDRGTDPQGRGRVRSAGEARNPSDYVHDERAGHGRGCPVPPAGPRHRGPSVQEGSDGMSDKLATVHGEAIIYTDYAKDGKMLSVQGSVTDTTAHLTDDERRKLIVMLGGRL